MQIITYTFTTKTKQIASLETRTNYKGNSFNQAQATNHFFATQLDYLDFIITTELNKKYLLAFWSLN